MPAEVECPDPAKLLAYAQDDLAPEDTTAFEQHLAGCGACLNQYLKLAASEAAVNIPHCHVVKEIGRGRFGVVYKAWWVQDKPRIVALKVLSSAGNLEESRFDREIAVQKKIESPWIVKCLDSGAIDGTRYYIMDFVEGVHLDDYLSVSCLSLTEKLAVFRRVCAAVADAHACGVVHRDLKPSNILVTPDGQPHILDFGICAVETDNWSSWNRQTITHVGDIIGTLKYMSPEQAWGGVAGPVQEQTDIWALGVMMYEIVTEGDYPYSRESTRDRPAPEALLERIRKELPRLPKLDSIPRGRDLEVLLERCLAWEPDCRVGSVRSLADDLQRYCQGQRIRTKPLSVFHRMKRLAVGGAARTRWMFSAALIGMVTAMLWLVVLLFDVGWFVTEYPYEGQKAPSAALWAPEQARESVRIIGVSHDTIDPVVDFAGANRIKGVTTDIRTWRGVHGHLMRRLAPARPKAVVWDYFFRKPKEQDADFVAGLKELEESGTPVVLASLAYRDDGTPDLSPDIVGPLAGQLRHGAIGARDMVDCPGEFVLANKRADETIVPSLALVTLAALFHPQARLELEWPEERQWIDLYYQLNPGAYLRGPNRIELSRRFRARHDQHAIRVGDLVACGMFELAKPERWQQQTVRYEHLLACSNDELRALVKDRLLIIGDLRTARFGFSPDRHRVKYDSLIIKDVPGCYLVADAIAGLVSRRYVRLVFLLSATAFLFALVAATVGCLLPIKLAAHRILEQARYRQVLWLVLFGLSALSFVLMVGTRNYAAVHLGFVGLSLLPPMAGAFWIEFARSRHRFLERDRRAIDRCEVASIETATLR